VLATFSGRKEKKAAPLKKEMITELVSETKLVRDLERFICKMINHYATPGIEDSLPVMTKPAATKEMLAARGMLLSWCGRYLTKAGDTLRASVVKAQSMGDVMPPSQRHMLLVKETAGKLSNIEDAFRKALVTRGLHNELSLPTALYPLAKSSTAMAPSQGAAAANPMPAAPSGAGLDPEALTEAHVFKKLQIAALNEFVLALIPCEGTTFAADTQPVVDGDTPVVKNGVAVEHFFTSGVKEEVVVVKSETTGVKDEQVVETNGVSDVKDFSPAGVGVWRKACLLTLSLPNATVGLARPGPVCPSGTHPGWVHFDVCVDDLRPLANDPKVIKAKPIALHPSLLDVGDLLFDAPDKDFMEYSYCKMLLEHGVLWAYGCASTSLEFARVSRVGDTDKPALTLQVRATKAFKKGELILAPAFGELKLATSAQGQKLSQLQSRIHKDMLSHVDATAVTTLSYKKRGDPDKTTKLRFVMHSPLLTLKLGGRPGGPGDGGRPQEKSEGNPAGEEPGIENVAPFWALLRAGGPFSSHNMEIDTVSFRDLGFEVQGSMYPKQPKGISFTASLPIARNVTPIYKGDVLTLPYRYGRGQEELVTLSLA